MSPIVATHSPIPAARRAPRAPAAARALALLFTWAERVRSRRQLAGLDDRMLADIGLDRATARGEFERPFWLDSRPRETEARTLLRNARRPSWIAR